MDKDGIDQITGTEDLSWMFNQAEVETAENIETTLIHKRTPHRKNFAALKQ